jgi:hypothetical protein
MYCILYAKDITPRLSYVAKFIFEQLLDSELTLTNKQKQYLASPLVKIHYGTSRLLLDEILIPEHPLLTEKKIKPQTITTFDADGLVGFFQLPDIVAADFECDFLAMSFYLLTRYEEYLPFEPDQYGRFAASQSLAQQAGFLQQPLVQLWALRLRAKLIQKFPEAVLALPKYEYQPTFDIDEMYKYQHRGAARTLKNIGGELVRGQLNSLGHRLKSLTKTNTADPYDTFDYIQKIHESSVLKPIFFFLVGDYGKYDYNLPYDHEQVQANIKTLSAQHTVGIHPSYRSNSDNLRVAMEKKRLEDTIHRPVTRSRQHFLKLTFPKTYRKLIENQIATDYSMGYADAVGFRASVAVPFFWYDLKKNEVTALHIVPFQAMDVTLQGKNYLNLSPEAAVGVVAQLAQTTREVGGTFVTLWHNSSFDTTNGWKGWNETYEKIVKQCI